MTSRSLAALGTATLVAIWAAVVLAVSGEPQQARLGSTARVDYQREVHAIIAANCLECHSQDKRKGGLSLATYSDVLEGGRSGAVVRPGESGRSLLLDRISGRIEPQMPRDEAPLSASEIAMIARWIDEGARLTPSSPPAPPPWEAPMTLARPAVPAVVWSGWGEPADRFVSAYLSARRVARPVAVSDATFARRVYLDAWGLLPAPEELQAFLNDQSPDKRPKLVARLLADSEKYAEHWITFWNDLLRNEDGVSYFSENAGRKSITDWLLPALRTNLAYDQFVTKLVNPTVPSDPDGFLTGVNWRGEASAAVMPWMQAAQNTAQVFLGVNLKCNACHDSFVSKWKLKDAYSLAAFFSPQAELQLFRCDIAQDAYATPAFLFPELNRAPPTGSLADRRATAAAIFTDPRLGRMPRTIVNRIWQRLLGRGLVANADEMDGKPWQPELLDWLAADFVEHGYDLKHLIQTILTSRAYEMPSVARKIEPPARDYVFTGPEVRRLTAEQFADAIGFMTGEWSVSPRGPAPAPAPAAAAAAKSASAPTQPTTTGSYAREWRVPSTNLTRALGRPIRDQVISVRPSQATTLQALELVNGETLTAKLSRGARRLVGELPSEPASRYNRAVAGRNAAPSTFDIDITGVNRLWLVVQEGGSNVPEIIQPAWAQAELIGPGGPVALSSLSPEDRSPLRSDDGPVRVAGSDGTGVRVKNPSVLVYDLTGRGFTRFRGIMGLENRASDIGATLNPQLRFYVFDTQPSMERLIPPPPALPLPAPPVPASIGQLIDRVFWHALGRAPTPAERRAAELAVRDPKASNRASASGLADLLWAILMKPEFQFIF